MIASARQGKKVDINDLLNESIDVPGFQKQEEVVENITSISHMIDKDEMLILLLNELVQSKFNEMLKSMEDAGLRNVINEIQRQLDAVKRSR